MSDGYHGSMPTEVFKGLLERANSTSAALSFEVSRMNAYRNAGLYANGHHIMGVSLQEFPEYTVRSLDGGIEALGWREALTTLLTEGWIKPNAELRLW